MNKNKIGKRFQIINQISTGGFGEIYSGYDNKLKTNVVIKIEKINNSNNIQLLLYEAKLLEYLKKGNLKIKVPNVLYYGIEDNNNYLVMEELGINLFTLLKKTNFQLNIFCIIKIVILIIEILRDIHDLYIIHRDLKPENIMFGKNINKENDLFIIDFGLSKRFVDKNCKHLPYSKNNGFRGTLRFSSINSHEGIQNSRRDDLESLCYIIVYMIKKKLPWEVYESQKNGEEKIYNLKKNINIDTLFEGIPVVFKEFYKIIKILKFEERPDYDKYIFIFNKFINQYNITDSLTINNILNNKKSIFHYENKNLNNSNDSNSCNEKHNNININNNMVNNKQNINNINNDNNDICFDNLKNINNINGDKSDIIKKEKVNNNDSDILRDISILENLLINKNTKKNPIIIKY